MRRSSFRRGNLSRVGGLVNGTMDELGLRHKILEHQAVDKWKVVVGPQIAASSVAERVRDGILFVCCKSSTWSSELTLHKDDILKRLNASVGKKVITDIRFSARGFSRLSQSVVEEVAKIDPVALETIDVDSQVASKVASTAPTSELAQRIQQAIITSKRLAELKRREGWKKCPKCRELHDGEHEMCDNCR